ncbi:hypothetical protein [Qipengyuania spongiae]|nr:hypothetical protein [Qipengyuania spongiae]
MALSIIVKTRFVAVSRPQETFSPMLASPALPERERILHGEQG